MKKLYDQLAYEVSKKTTRTYSTSFSLGILALHPSIRPAVYAVYGYVRIADEIVDSFHDYDKRILLERFRQNTDQALAEKVSINPIIQSFQETVSTYHIDRDLIDRFLCSMEMDLEVSTYDSESYADYIYGSAEVVGLMCLYIFVEGNEKLYTRLKPYARALGSAFQKVNFLRDMREDYRVLGRVYFPHLDMKNFDQRQKQDIEQEIEEEFKTALEGIKKLPKSSKFGVYLAYRYYLSLFNKIRSLPPERILGQRIRISNPKKLYLSLQSFIGYKFKRLT